MGVKQKYLENVKNTKLWSPSHALKVKRGREKNERSKESKEEEWKQKCKHVDNGERRKERSKAWLFGWEGAKRKSEKEREQE